MFESPGARGGHNGDRNDANCSLNDAATVTAAPTLWIGVRSAAEAMI